MIGSTVMKWLGVFLLFIVLPILLMRYMVAKTIEVVQHNHKH